MDNQWKEERCENCNFPRWGDENIVTPKATKGHCLKNPPSILSIHAYADRYPCIHKDTPACSCWREKVGS